MEPPPDGMEALVEDDAHRLLEVLALVRPLAGGLRRPQDAREDVLETGAAHAHHGYLFANARATRIKLLVHDGFGVWCAARRLNAGHFAWPRETSSMPLSLTQNQFDALIVGLPWQRLPEMSVITRM